MAKSMIQLYNPSTQAVDVNGVINPGTTVRRFGCNLRQVGNGVEVNGEGYYGIYAAVSVAATAAGPVSVGILENGVQIPGAITTTYQATAAQPVAVPIVGTLRKGCSSGASVLTAVLLEGAGNVESLSWKVVKE